MKHRSHFKQRNKAHKDGHSKKETFQGVTSHRKRYEEQGQKARRQQADAARRENQVDLSKSNQLIGSDKGAPKIIGILPCSSSAPSTVSFGRWEGTSDDFQYPSGIACAGQFKCHILPLEIGNDLDKLIDIGPIVDILLLTFMNGESFNEFGMSAIRVLKAIGFPQCMSIVVSDGSKPVNRADLNDYRDMIQKIIPEGFHKRVLSLNSEEDVEQLVRFVSVTAWKDISWKHNRPYVVVQGCRVDHGTGNLAVIGYLRNAPMSVHQVVTIPHLGDYYMSSLNRVIPAVELRHPMIYESGEGEEVTWEIHPPQRIDLRDNLEQQEILPEEPHNEEEQGRIEEDIEEEEPEEQGSVDTKMVPRERDELEYPDEFDQYDGTVKLRERLRRYRGLKSFQSSPWDRYEDLPADYSKIFEFSNFPRTSESVIAEQLTANDALPGQLVEIVLETGSDTAALLDITEGKLLVIIGLFRHETKMTVLNCTFTNNSDNVIASKTPMMVRYAFRQLFIRPLFSEATHGEKHLLVRNVEPGQTVIASFIAPAIMQSCPCAFFVNQDGLTFLTGTGSVRTVDPNRMIIKRIVLTGRLYKAVGKTARVKFMFFNREDIEYYKPVMLQTRMGLRGHIVKSIGLTGCFKAHFDKIVNSQDSLYLPLYKRVYPRLKADDETYVTTPVTFTS